MKTGIDAAAVVVATVLLGLFLRVKQGSPPSWYLVLEKLIGIGFVGSALVTALILPLSATAGKIWFLYYTLQVALYAFLPGKSYDGLALAKKPEAISCVYDRKNEKTGKVEYFLKYRCNGLLAFVIILATYFIGGYVGLFEYTLIYDNFASLLNWVNVFSFTCSLLLYIKGLFSPDRITRNNPIEDFWYGTELNPHTWIIDWKFFSESRPGLIGWVLVNFSIAAAQYKQLGYITTPMLLVSIFHFIYVFDYFWVESYIYSTWDITDERFGWMLLWGDYVWVPFYYTIQSWYLLYLPRDYHWSYNALNIAVFFFGYLLFRGANGQKHNFKENPNKLWWFWGCHVNKAPKTLQTTVTEKNPRGTKLLIDGWWGMARHINYLGDLILAISWGMPCAFETYITYGYFFFMLGLLLHRFARDDAKCAEKYGKDWDSYCKAVPYKLIPFVF